MTADLLAVLPEHLVSRLLERFSGLLMELHQVLRHRHMSWTSMV
jgi:hypothetical protein